MHRGSWQQSTCPPVLVPKNAQRRFDALLAGKASGLQNLSHCSKQPLLIVGLLILLCLH